MSASIISELDKKNEAKKELRKTNRPDEIDRLKNNITYSENRIDELIYKLYGLNKNDISIIEKNLPYGQ